MKINISDNLDSLAKTFRDNSPFPHIVINDLLAERDAQNIRKSIMKEKFEKKHSDLFSLSQTNDLSTTKDLALKELYLLFSSKDFIRQISKITGVSLKGKIDMAGSLYEDTDFLLCQDDRLEKRSIAYIYYLSSRFTEQDGGALALLSDKEGKPGEIVRRYIPVWNSMILFKVSSQSWHEVEEVLSAKKRYAIGGWFY
ncbi:hypothetical protein FJZ18_02885 [Candidatus Pacearchaeota archaeon]|nr:hypothetical protein [Candidatus Pacearchaeota archaeon]